jgi:large repetitive protein
MSDVARARPHRFWRRALITGAVATVAACGGGDTPEQTAPQGRAKALAIAAPAASLWSAPIPLSLVPTAAAHLPDGRLLLWASDSPLAFADPGQTYTATFDPATLTATQALVTQTGHNMFCSGTSNLPDGSLLISGGKDSGKTSLYNPLSNSWTTGATMNIPRGYQANTVLQDGSVLTLGGSWSGAQGGKHGEVWTPAGGWRQLPGVPVDPALGSDPGGVYRSDNHMWLFAAPNGRVLHAGPSVNMNWISTAGDGSIRPIGARGDDAYSMGGNAVMYDIGKILKVGGAPGYEDLPATSASHVIDINGEVSVRTVAPMAYPRIFANGVVLPNGQVVIIGGQTIGKLFSDDNSILVPELWDPTSETFTPLPPIAVGRNYHSVALLMPDGRVMSGGGGLCGAGCGDNHPDVQILTPHYLLNPDGTPATRPLLTAAPAVVTLGTSIAVTADNTAASFALVRMSSTTHTVNNDQRRVPLQFTATGGGGFDLSLPSNPGVLLPGYYMLFAMNADGVPSIAKILRVDLVGAPTLTNPGSQNTAIGASVQLAITATTSSGTLNYSATGLPVGLSINPSTGAISGNTSAPGTYTVVLSASNGTATSSTNIRWAVFAASAGKRFARLDILSAVNGGPWSSMAEFNLLDASGAVIPRNGWVVTADSQETGSGSYGAANAIDGDAGTLWHTQWSSGSAPLPHRFTVDTGINQTIYGFKVLPRADGTPNGMIANWQFSVSSDGLNWIVLGQGSFGAAADATEKTGFFPPSATYHPPALAAVVDQTSAAGNATSLGLSANDSDGNALTFSASGLPPGLAIDITLGRISGTPTATGIFTVNAQVSDGIGGTASRSFSWTITATPTGPVQFVRLEALSEVNGNPWTSMAEFKLLDGSGAVLARSAWTATSNSQETLASDGAAANAIDGSAASIWHTQWSVGGSAQPHTYTVNLGQPQTVTGFTVLPRSDGIANGMIANWRFWTSTDGVNWIPAATGVFANNAAETLVAFSPQLPANQPPSLALVASQNGKSGTAASLTLAGADPDNDPLSYSASGLPAGLTLNTTSGAISGTPTTAAVYDVTTSVSDGRGGTASRSFTWTVTAAPAGPVQFVRLEALSEVNGNPWTSMAEFKLLDGSGAVLARSAWTASSNSQETLGSDGAAANAIDGGAASIWHTQWLFGSPAQPHTYTVNLGQPQTVTGFKMLPRTDGVSNGMIADWRFWTSADGVIWVPAGSGTFANTSAEKTVTLP